MKPTNLDKIVYFKEVNIPNEEKIIEQIQNVLFSTDFENYLWENNSFSWNKLLDQHKDTVLAEVPDLKKWLDYNDLDCIRMAVIRVAPHTKENLHIDIVEPTRSYGMNFPLLNCDNTHTVFLQEANDDILLIEEKLHYIDENQNNKPVNYWDIVSDLKEAARTTVNKAHWLKVNEPHYIDNPNDGVRLTLSLRFEKLWPEFENAIHHPMKFIET